MGKPFEKITVIGTGTLGTQIALLAINAGYDVTIYDVREGAFKEAFERLRSNIQEKGIEPLIPWDRLEAIKTDIHRFQTIFIQLRHVSPIFTTYS